MLSFAVLRAQSDERLAQLSAEGSELAFELIVRRYRRELLTYCRRLLRSDSRAEDATQQALLAAWSALRNGAEVHNLRAWLYRITHNQAIDAWRRPGWELAELPESLPSLDTPDTDLERRMLTRDTLAAVAALPVTQRDAILRVAVAGDSYAQVAESMGVSEGALRGLLYRARITIRTAVASILPLPIVVWAGGHSRRNVGAMPWLSDTLLGSGGAGASAVAAKSALVLASSVAIVGGGVTAHIATVIPPRRARDAALTRPATSVSASRRATASVGPRPSGAARSRLAAPFTGPERSPRSRAAQPASSPPPTQDVSLQLPAIPARSGRLPATEGSPQSRRLVGRSTGSPASIRPAVRASPAVQASSLSAHSPRSVVMRPLARSRADPSAPVQN